MPVVERPSTWGEVETFVRNQKLDQDEYFTLDGQINRSAEVWGSDVWNIAIWLCEGQNEGFYLHIDAIRRHEGIRSGSRQSMMLGKFWSMETGIHAVDLLTRYIYGFPIPVEGPEQPVPGAHQADRYNIVIQAVTDDEHCEPIMTNFVKVRIDSLAEAFDVVDELTGKVQDRYPEAA